MLAAVVAGLGTGCELHNQGLSPLRPGAVVLAFGDSMIEGFGVPTKAQAFPAQLERLIQRRVVAAGVAGETTADGLERLPGLLENVSPDLVIICMGANDLLHGEDPGDIARNLRDMVRMVRASESEVVLVAAPHPRHKADPHPLFAEVAEQTNTPLVRKAVTNILSQPSLRADIIHPNPAGYAQLAEAVAQALRTHGALPRARH